MYVYLQIYNTPYINKGIWTKIYVYLPIYKDLYIDKGI